MSSTLVLIMIFDEFDIVRNPRKGIVKRQWSKMIIVGGYENIIHPDTHTFYKLINAMDN